jgi:hypothetical protein
MSKGVWSIAVLGFVCVVIMVFLMLASLSMYQSAPAAQNAKLSNAIREQFGFPQVGAGVRDVRGDLVLQVEYVSAMDSGFKDELMDRELAQVAAFAQKAYDGKDKRFIRRMKLTRSEVQGSGCWTRTLQREMSVDEPFQAPPRRLEPAEDEGAEKKEEEGN